MITDIVEDLRMHKDSFHWRAADEIERLRAENAKLLEALAPFAAQSNEFRDEDDAIRVNLRIKVGDLRAAAAALKEMGE